MYNDRMNIESGRSEKYSGRKDFESGRSEKYTGRKNFDKCGSDNEECGLNVALNYIYVAKDVVLLFI